VVDVEDEVRLEHPGRCAGLVTFYSTVSIRHST